VTKIIGISGRKQAGKNTLANQIIGTEMSSLGITQVSSINKKGQLIISDLFGDAFNGIFDVTRQEEAMQRFKKDNLDPYIKLYSFADLLKKSVCMDILGLTYEQCFGTDEQKNGETHLLWENMPGITTNQHNLQIGAVDLGCKTFGVVYHKPGPMTAREVMQFVGTEVFRKMIPNVWGLATMNQIKRDDSDVAIVADVRFPDEVDIIKDNGGIVIRLTKNSFDSSHDSETALDQDKYDWSNFDFVLDNKDMNVIQQCQAANSLLEEIGFKWESQ
jgi:hypothetical protein